MAVQSYFLLIFSLNPFIKFYLSWPENGSATLSFTAGRQAGTELQRCKDQDKETYTEVRNPGERDAVNQNKETGACFLSNSFVN